MGNHGGCQPPFASSSGKAPAAQSLWHERTGALTHALLSEEQHRFLAERLDQLRQGDLINLGATSVVGRGPSPALKFADPQAIAGADQPWSVTLVTELGWYVVLSQDCDIARSPEVEPCIVVCPLEAMPIIERQCPSSNGRRSGADHIQHVSSPSRSMPTSACQLEQQAWPTRALSPASRSRRFSPQRFVALPRLQRHCGSDSWSGWPDDLPEPPILTMPTHMSFSPAAIA